MRLALIALTLGLALGLASIATAHHGWGSYDADNPMLIKGAIESVVLQNPHGE